jgi:membrane protein
MKVNASQIKGLLVKSWQEFNKDQAPRLGAALAYYTALSIAPLLILLIGIAGLVLGREAAEGQLFGELRNMVGSQGAGAVQEIVKNASKPSEGIMASVIGFLLLVFGASSVAGELKTSLNLIWNRPINTDAGIGDTVKERSTALVIVLGCGFLLLVSLAVSSAVAAAGTVVADSLPIPEVVMHVLNMLVSFVVITGVFAALFKYLPDVSIEWNDVFAGAAFTAALFTIGKFLIGMYLGKASVGSAYGAAGSLVILLVWVYYSAQIFFFGAEFTQVYSEEYGSDPLRKRRAGSPAHSPQTQAYAESASSPNSSRALAATGSLLGGALALSKIASIFRSRKR